jgi:hypothetical protein
MNITKLLIIVNIAQMLMAFLGGIQLHFKNEEMEGSYQIF